MGNSLIIFRGRFLSQEVAQLPSNERYEIKDVLIEAKVSKLSSSGKMTKFDV